MRRFLSRLGKYALRGRDADEKPLKILAVAYGIWYEMESSHVTHHLPPIDYDLPGLAVRRLEVQRDLRRKLDREPRDDETAAAVAADYYSGDASVKAACRAVERLARQARQWGALTTRRYWTRTIVEGEDGGYGWSYYGWKEVPFRASTIPARLGATTHKPGPTHFIGGHPYPRGTKTEAASVED
ncbi:MAG TPA: hypothetical protein VIJ66_02435 [Solirubrobacteraceae bacterium]